jgi:HSP20 family protein
MALMTKLKKKIIPWRRKPIENRDLLNLRDDMNRAFDRFFLSPFNDDEWAGRRWSGDEPVMETSEGIIVREEIPGIDPEDLQVTVRDGSLHIEVDKEEEWGQRDDNWHGYRYGRLHRVVSLPEGLDLSQAAATSKHGLLTVQIPWTVETRQRSRRITVDVQ